MTIAVIAEKPSVARDIAKVLGANQNEKKWYRGNNYIVTWAIGHLVTLAEPHEMNPGWKAWRLEHLPMIPHQWPLKVLPKTRPQFNAVKKIINSREVNQIVCATDAGREGELIFRYIYQAAGCRKSVLRLWISSLTHEAIRQGFNNLRAGTHYEPLADAARGRSQADWLVGMNLSRLYSLHHNEVLSVGRVQTPTLVMLVEREIEIQNFIPEPYIEIVATFSSPSTLSSHHGTGESHYQGTWFRNADNKSIIPSGAELKKAKRLPADGGEASRIVDRVRNGSGCIESIDK